MAQVEAENLCKSYGKSQALSNVSFKIEPGQIFGLIGPNGAGKTTLIKILSTLSPPTSGRASISGWDVRNDPGRVRRSLGLVFQGPSVDPRMTGRENLELHAILYGVPASVAKKRIDQALEQAGLAARAHDLVKTYSGGLRRRLELVRAFLHRPPVLILDEPTSGLDIQARRQIWDYLLSIRSQDGVAVLVTTHYLEEAGYCDRLATIERGRLEPDPKFSEANHP